jgi:hypothetical protein
MRSRGFATNIAFGDPLSNVGKGGHGTLKKRCKVGYDLLQMAHAPACGETVIRCTKLWGECVHPILIALGHTCSPGLPPLQTVLEDWIASEGIMHLAVHFDIDVLDPKTWSWWYALPLTRRRTQ